MTEGREDDVAIVAPDSADHLARFTGLGVEAFRQGKIAIACCAQQRVEVGTGMIGN